MKKGKKAAPRFELGIKDLQSSALPLGHAAPREIVSPYPDRISQANQYLLVISNGHGEDLIALRVLDEIHRLQPGLTLEVLPLVGEGKAFQPAISQGWLEMVGPSLRLPSGGFGNQSFRGLLADINAGLLWNTFKQWFYICSKASQLRTIVAVGDLLPLFFAWTSGANFGFIGTPKSDYTWLSGPGSSFSDLYHRLKGTEWDPWEVALMRSSRCKLVAVRDRLTARGLKRYGVMACAPGNPMMDGLKKLECPSSLKPFRRLLLLCGSRSPEALNNLNELLIASHLIEKHNPLAILVPTGAEPDLNQIETCLRNLGYKPCEFEDQLIGVKACWYRDSCLVLLGPGQFSHWANWAEVGLANAGTATEQLVGLGIPALSLPGNGPQFKYDFAVRQSRLLGGAVVPCKSKTGLARRAEFLLENHSLRRQIGFIGASRMGSEGGSLSLASIILNFLFD